MLPAGEFECSSRLLYVSVATVESPRPFAVKGVHRRTELPVATFTEFCIPAPRSAVE